jgi:hypothetical protein
LANGNLSIYPAISKKPAGCNGKEPELAVAEVEVVDRVAVSIILHEI